MRSLTRSGEVVLCQDAFGRVRRSRLSWWRWFQGRRQIGQPLQITCRTWHARDWPVGVRQSLELRGPLVLRDSSGRAVRSAGRSRRSVSATLVFVGPPSSVRMATSCWNRLGSIAGTCPSTRRSGMIFEADFSTPVRGVRTSWRGSTCAPAREWIERSSRTAWRWAAAMSMLAAHAVRPRAARSSRLAARWPISAADRRQLHDALEQGL